MPWDVATSSLAAFTSRLEASSARGVSSSFGGVFALKVGHKSQLWGSLRSKEDGAWAKENGGCGAVAFSVKKETCRAPKLHEPLEFRMAQLAGWSKLSKYPDVCRRDKQFTYDGRLQPASDFVPMERGRVPTATPPA